MAHIGVDESGKGDYFGYLVISAVYVDNESEKKLAELKVRDSKKLSDPTAKKMAAGIKKACKYDIVKISPEKYNILHKKFGNLNKLLAWGHARAIENLLNKTREVDYILVDKFGDEKFIENELFRKKIKVKLIQRTKAEEDIAVAAASVLARAEFLSTLRKLSLDIDYKLPKGATHVIEAGKELVKKNGEEILGKIAKTHFKTTKKILKKQIF
jgi:ribonuclease HIII